MEPSDLTQLLRLWKAGDHSALDRLTPLIYDELKRQARRYMKRERAPSLETTALVHEAWLRLAQGQAAGWQDRAHFFAVSATVMRRLLVDLARSRTAARRGGAPIGPPIDPDAIAGAEISRDLLALEDAMQQLARHDERKARVVELRFYGGLSVEETAEVLGVSAQTVLRDWKLARAWLNRELTSGGASSQPRSE